jgi:hypothetical protein
VNVGQGDAALLISPHGKTVFFDTGNRGDCDGPSSYVRHLGIDRIDYLVASHDHADHIGCAVEVFAAFPLRLRAPDRGGSYGGETFTRYLHAVGNKCKTAVPGTKTIVSDGASSDPAEISIVAASGNGVATTKQSELFERINVSGGGDKWPFSLGTTACGWARRAWLLRGPGDRGEGSCSGEGTT